MPRADNPEDPEPVDPATDKGIQITVTDLNTGRSDSAVIWNKYVIVTSGSCYLAHTGIYPSTEVLTVKGVRDK
jgi:hypothetical protein